MHWNFLTKQIKEVSGILNLKTKKSLNNKVILKYFESLKNAMNKQKICISLENNLLISIYKNTNWNGKISNI
jgi:hypothetical protein